MGLKDDITNAMKESPNALINTRLRNIADMVNQNEDDVREKMKELEFSDYVDLMRALRDQDVEAAERILGFNNINEASNDTYAMVSYDYHDDWGSIELIKDGETVEDWDDYFGANETGNPLAAKFVELCKKHGINPTEIDILSGDDEDIHPIRGRKMGRFDGKTFKWVEEAYSGGGTLSPGEMRARKTGMQTEPEASAGVTTSPAAKAQAMSRLGKNNLGGATAQQAADALSKAGEGKPLTPIQRKAMAQQASSVDALASDPRTATQFRNLLNKLNQK